MPPVRPFLRVKGSAPGTWQRLRGYIRIDGRAPNDGSNGVVISDCLLQRLDVQRTDAIRSGIAVRGGVEGLAPRALGDGAEGGGEHLALGRQDQVGAPDDGGRTLARQDGHARQVQRVHGARARRVEREARPMQVEDVVDTVAEQRDAAARDAVRLGVLRVAVLHELVVVVEVAHEDARLGARQRLQRGAGRLQRLVDDLEELALRRVQARGLLRVHSEEGWVKPARVFFEKAAAARVEGSGTACFGVVPGIEIDAIGGEIAV